LATRLLLLIAVADVSVVVALLILTSLIIVLSFKIIRLLFEIKLKPSHHHI